MRSNSEILPFLETLKIMTAYLGPQRSFRTNLEFFLQTLVKRHDFLRAHLVLFEPETGLLRLRFADLNQEINEATYSPGVGVTGQVFATGKPVIVEKISESSLFMNLLYSRTDAEMQNNSFISVPVLSPFESDHMSARDVIGTLNVDTPIKEKDALKIQCLFLELVASLIANCAAYLQEELSRLWRFDALTNEVENNFDDLFFSFSSVMRHVYDQAHHLAQGRAPLLLLGEVGVGKVTLAKRIHAASSRKEMPFIVCHCTMLSEENMMIDLFGYQKGAFIGAVQTQKGYFEQANYGTIFLNNIEALSKEAQSALLHLIQEHQICRIGFKTPIQCDVRLIASSSTSLNCLVQQGLFLEELYTRLNLYALHIPPLRDRREDIIPLAEKILSKIAEKSSNSIEGVYNDTSKDFEVKQISHLALQLLTQYYWPGNVLELQKCMEYAVNNCNDKVICSEDLPPSLQAVSSTLAENDLSLGDAVERFEKEMIIDALIKANGNVLKAATILKSSYRIVSYKVKKYKINPRRFLYDKNVDSP